jgi:drug/metabolite transporter (DMT)-like permease
MMFYVMAIGWSFISLIFFMGNGFTEIGNLTLRGWMGVGFLGIFCSGLAYIAWYDALQILSTAQPGVFLYAVILFGVWLVNRN